MHNNPRVRIVRIALRANKFDNFIDVKSGFVVDQKEMLFRVNRRVEQFVQPGNDVSQESISFRHVKVRFRYRLRSVEPKFVRSRYDKTDRDEAESFVYLGKE